MDLKSIFPSQIEKLSRTGNSFGLHENQQYKLPVLDLNLYYRSKKIQKNQSNTLLHFPISKNLLEEKQDQLDSSQRDPKNRLKLKTRFTSFQWIGERNQDLVASGRDDEKHLNTRQASVSKINRTDSSNNEIETELQHNKIMYSYLTKQSTEHVVGQLNLLRDKIQRQQRLKRSIDQVRSYPSQPKNKFGSMHLPDDKQLKTIDLASTKISTHKVPQMSTNTFFGTPIGFWLKPEENGKYKPEFREMTCFTQIGHKAFMYGGIGMTVLGDMIEVDMNTGRAKKHQQFGDRPINRYAGAIHAFPYPVPLSYTYNSAKVQNSPLISGRLLLLFAGETSYNPQIKSREALCDLRVFNADTGEWKYMRTNSDVMPEQRRSFGSCIVGKGMLIHGGLTSRAHYLNDLYFLNFSQCKWVSLNQVNQQFPGGVAYHHMIPIYNKPQQIVIGETKIEKVNHQMIKKYKIEGVYSFGGCSQDQHRNASYDVPFLSILNLTNLTWTTPETLGEQPMPRILHTVTLLPTYNTICVYGGRNDFQPYPYMGDMTLLQLDTLTWVKVSQCGRPNQIRAGHAAFLHKTQLIVMGGVNLEGYLSSTIERCELDRAQARALSDSYQIRNPPQDQEITHYIAETVDNSEQKRTAAPSTKKLLPIDHPEKQQFDLKTKIEELRFEKFVGNSQSNHLGHRRLVM